MRHTTPQPADEPILTHVQAVLARHALLQPDACLLVGVSGGPDSLALLHLLWRLHAAAHFALHVAHLDHCLRGEQSAAEARFVAATAAAWQLPATVAQRDVPARIARTGENKQAAARSERYAFLGAVAHQIGAHAVLVAHHADDQAETLLLHLLHGAGLAGLRGMREQVPWHEWQPDAPTTNGAYLLRPLLAVRRAELEAYCAAHQLAPRYDPANDDPHSTRSRIRHDLLPALHRYNPQIVAALGRTAQSLADDYAYLHAALDQQWHTLAEQRPGSIRLDRQQWHALPPALQRHAMRRVLLLLGNASPTHDQISTACAAATQGTGTRTTAGGTLLLEVQHHGIIIRDTAQPAAPWQWHTAAPQLAQPQIELPAAGSVPISAHWHATVARHPASDAPPTPDRWCVLLDAERLDGALLLRRRQAGDRFRPAGGVGSRRLQDFFVDQRVPRELRDAWPLLATAHSLVWVAGLRADHRFAADSRSQQIVRVWLHSSPLDNDTIGAVPFCEVQE